MDTNIISEYLKFIKNELLKFYSIMLDKNYQKKLVEPFIDKYMQVRYNNETEFPREKDIVNRIGKELQTIYDKLITIKNEETLKNIYSLFGYIVYFDNVIFIEEGRSLLDCFFKDETIRIVRTPEITTKITNWYKNLEKKETAFTKAIQVKDFSLQEKRLKKGLYYLTLNQQVKITNLYSEYAIDKAFNSPVVKEDALFILYIKASEQILDNVISLDFSRRYIVDFSSTLWEKDKKRAQLLNIFDNLLAKKYLQIKIDYQEYNKNKEQINALMREGYTFATLLDETFEGEISSLILFSTVFVYEDNEFFDMIMENKKRINSKIIVL